jgi:hypothetical protein
MKNFASFSSGFVHNYIWIVQHVVCFHNCFNSWVKFSTISL